MMVSPIIDKKGYPMNASLRTSFTEYLAVCAGALALVFLVAFVSIPFSLRAHPGELLATKTLIEQHLG